MNVSSSGKPNLLLSGDWYSRIKAHGNINPITITHSLKKDVTFRRVYF
jgi:hypothetical protein